MTFHIGQKVVCVDDRENIWSEQWITKGNTYTVDGLGIYEDGRPIVYLSEITAPIMHEPRMRFYASRFRAAVETNDAISVFTAMLTPKRTLTEAMAP